MRVLASTVHWFTSFGGDAPLIVATFLISVTEMLVLIGEEVGREHLVGFTIRFTLRDLHL